MSSRPLRTFPTYSEGLRRGPQLAVPMDLLRLGGHALARRLERASDTGHGVVIHRATVRDADGLGAATCLCAHPAGRAAGRRRASEVVVAEDRLVAEAAPFHGDDAEAVAPAAGGLQIAGATASRVDTDPRCGCIGARSRRGEHRSGTERCRADAGSL